MKNKRLKEYMRDILILRDQFSNYKLIKLEIRLILKTIKDF